MCVYVFFLVTFYFWHKNRDAGKRPTLQHHIPHRLIDHEGLGESERDRRRE